MTTAVYRLPTTEDAAEFAAEVVLLDEVDHVEFDNTDVVSIAFKKAPKTLPFLIRVYGAVSK